MNRKLWVVVLALFMVGLTWSGGQAEDKIITMSTTTSTQASGLLDVVLPELKKDTGIEVKVVAKGTGAALRDGEDGNVDVIFVHAKQREEDFVKNGFGTQRYPVMHNDFVIVGPKDDPAGIKDEKDVAKAMEKIAASGKPFISRGDDSGTHTKEQALWKSTTLPMETKKGKLVKKGKETEIEFTAPKGDWYLSIGQGMGKTLVMTEEKQGYTLTDRGTYIKYKFGKQPPLELEILSEGDERLANPYGVIPINPEKHPQVKYDLAKQFAEWLVSPRGQAVIANYRLEGQTLFFPDAIPDAK